MNKTAIKQFALWARNILIKDTMYQARLAGISPDGIAEPLPNSTADIQFFDIGTASPAALSGAKARQRRRLAQALRRKAASSDYGRAYEAFIEEVAYTWFNRLIALRFMEVNGYLPTGLRVLSSQSGKIEPDMVTTPFDADFDFTAEEIDRITAMKEANDMNGLFRFLFLKQCNALHDILPRLFEATEDYTELLLTISVTDQDGVVYRLVHDIDEADFDVSRGGQVEILGWLYQYYISEPKDELINAHKKYQKNDIPFVTQLFTSDWIVRYMVENSLGRLWIQGHTKNAAEEEQMAKAFGWEYYLPKSEQDTETEEQFTDLRRQYSRLRPENLTVLDPCMGSGHILVYAFDVLMDIYRACGYGDRDAAELILEHNLYGIDIDDRAFQLAYFSVLMKARQYNRRILRKNTACHICVFKESYVVDRNSLQEFGRSFTDELRKTALTQLNYLLDTFCNAKEFGSILQIDNCDWELLENIVKDKSGTGLDLYALNDLQAFLLQMIATAQMLKASYEVVISNPPYLNSSYMPDELKKYVSTHYGDAKNDLFAVFIQVMISLCKKNGHVGMLTPYVWMFISSHEKLRRYVCNSTVITSLVQLEYNAFEAACVPVAAFTLCKSNLKLTGEYIKLSEFKGIENQAPKTLEAVKNKNCGYRYTAQQANFAAIPGSPIAYWVSDICVEIFNSSHALNYYVDCKSGIMAGNEQFIKLWYEVEKFKIKFNCHSFEDMGNGKWFPLNSGGEYRNWYGNNIKVIDLWNDGANIKNNVKNYRLRDKSYYFKKGITWGRITSSKIAFREVIDGSLFGDAGPVAFIDKDRYYVLGYLCSKVAEYLLNLLNPTLNSQVSDLLHLPLIMCEIQKGIILKLVQENISLSKSDWDSFETSWDFVRHPLVPSPQEAAPSGRIRDYYERWKTVCAERFDRLKANEEELNRIFIGIYGLEDELTPDVADKDVTVARVYDRKDDIPESMKGNAYVLTKEDVVKSLLSYAVGCLFGRYAADQEGLVYAGGTWDAERYKGFAPDADNVIPIMDDDYFLDDIVDLICRWLGAVYGSETVEENLSFIASAIGGKGQTTRGALRSYFLKDFFKDHCRTYKKRPIYWLFDSGRQNGFKALVYVHRYNGDTIGKVRVDYLRPVERIYEQESARLQEVMDKAGDTRTRNKAAKTREKLQKQLAECRAYDEMLAHLAADRRAIDLDDGVKANYETVQTDRDGKKYAVLAKI